MASIRAANAHREIEFRCYAFGHAVSGQRTEGPLNLNVLSLEQAPSLALSGRHSELLQPLLLQRFWMLHRDFEFPAFIDTGPHDMRPRDACKAGRCHSQEHQWRMRMGGFSRNRPF